MSLLILTSRDLLHPLYTLDSPGVDIEIMHDDEEDDDNTSVDDNSSDDFIIVPIPDCFKTDLPMSKSASTSIIIKKGQCSLSFYWLEILQIQSRHSAPQIYAS